LLDASRTLDVQYCAVHLCMYPFVLCLLIKKYIIEQDTKILKKQLFSILKNIIFFGQGYIAKTGN